jgi:Cdc6-like AAA superfamily ATPase
MTQFINPFTARSGTDPKYIVGREQEIRFFNVRLSHAMRGKCDHYVITGSWGVCKTVLLRQMKLAAQSKGTSLPSDTRSCF